TNLRFEKNTVENGDGGAMLLEDTGQVFLQNCIFYENTCEVGLGGGVAQDLDETLLYVVNCTFNGNIADKGGAIFSAETDIYHTFVQNTIAWGDSAPELAALAP